ncbi:MAG: TatD family deoxyribonuclease [Dehalococcoidia bacterium]|nr:TatD family deoxyribonuclease [Dehalococcoidia bacterium]
MVDSHVHLDDLKYREEEIEGVVGRALSSGVTAMFCAGVHLASSQQAVQLAGRFPEVYAAVGFHPHEASKLSPGDLTRLRDLSGQPKVVAVGEIGLDYHYDHSPRAVQRAAFRSQLDLAAELRLPVVVHNRDSSEDMWALLSGWAAQAAAHYQGRPLGMLHCFSDDLEAAHRYVELGFYISLACTVTYPKSHHTRAVAAGLPLDRLLTETDSPYLPPQTRRGQRNEPAFVASVVDQIAAVRGVAPEVVATQTALNAAALFSIPVAVAR